MGRQYGQINVADRPVYRVAPALDNRILQRTPNCARGACAAALPNLSTVAVERRLTAETGTLLQ